MRSASGRLADDLRDILSVASVEGEDFTAQVIARVEEIRERQLLRTLSQELEKHHHLVREQEEVKVGRQFLTRYEFAHAVFQQYLYDDLGAGERRMLHGEIAAALEDLYQERAAEIVVQLAHHYAEAGVGDKAIAYLLQAGDRARGLYAYQEAISYYQRALEFLRDQRDHERTARTLMKLGLTYHIAFDFRRARQAYEEGFALWQRVGGQEPSAALPPAPHALRIDWPYPPLTLDPALAGDIDSTGIIDQLFSGLVTLDPEMDVLPDVAHSWDVLDEGRKYVFHLRPDVRWSDGAPVTADDFAYAWRRVLTPATESPAARLLYDIRGARAFHQGETTDPASVGVQAPDPATLAVELEQPAGHFLYLLAYNASYPVPRHAVEARSKDWTAAKHIVTNGPFRLVSWNLDKVIVLARDPQYHGRGQGNVQRVKVSLASEWSARLNQYEAGNLDTLALWDLRPDRDRARQQHADEYLLGPLMSTLSVGFDASRPPFDDARVRRAFVHAVDRERLADVVLGGYEFPATGGFLPPGMPGHSPGIGLPFDPAQAQALLAEAGYPQGRDFPAVELLTDRGRDVLNQYLQAQWRGNLGVEVAWQAVEWAEMMERLDQTPPHLFLFAWAADYPDPDNFLRACDALARTGWRDETYEGLVREARQLTDQGQRMARYTEADRLLVQEAAIMPFTYGRIHLLVQPWVHRFPTSAIKWWYWKDVVIEPH
ncbi:MAG: tetratricopeptide repeat protein [Chloroflexi bacterium]|nr:tetratricopeptide repeat protein [Chloroflexota bacterium]